MADQAIDFAFDLNQFPWTPEAREDILERRHVLGGDLFIDNLLSIAGIDFANLYPPQTIDVFRELYGAIQQCGFDDVKKNCLFYYLLKAWGTEVEGQFAKRKSIPRQFVILSDGYFHLDQGNIEAGVTCVCDPRVTPDFTSKILQAIWMHPDARRRAQLVRRFVKVGKAPLSEQPDIELYMQALCEVSITDAWLYQRTFPEVPGPNAPRARLLRSMLNFTLSPQLRPDALKVLVALPFTAYENEQINTYAITPPHHLTEQAVAVLHELINTRLIHQGQYSEAIRMNEQFSYSAFNSGGGPVSEGITVRRNAMKELVGVLPEIQRKLLDIRLDTQDTLRVNGSSHLAPLSNESSADLEASWYQMDKSAASLNTSSFTWSSSLLRSSQMLGSSSMLSLGSSIPVSASAAFRQADPKTAVLQAFAEASTLEGSPAPASRTSSTLPTSSSFRSSLRQSLPGVPFGITPPASSSPRAGLSRMMNGNTFVIRPRTSNVDDVPTPRQSLFAPPAPSLASRQMPPPLTMKHSISNPFYVPPPSTATGETEAPSTPQLKNKRSFGQVTRSPVASFAGPEGDLSVSDLSKPREQAPEDDAEDDDDDLVINPPSSTSIYLRSRSSKSGKAQADEHSEDELADDGEANGLPGAFPTPKASAAPAIRATRTHPKTQSSATASSSLPATKKKTTTRREQKPSPPAPAQRAPRTKKTPTPEPEPVVRRSTRLSATPSGRGSPERKKARSSAEPEPITQPAKKGVRRKVAATSKRQPSILEES